MIDRTPARRTMARRLTTSLNRMSDRARVLII